MPYPTPHMTNIKLLSEVPLDASYRHSIYFANESAQATYFANKAKPALVYTNCMYHRVEDELRVDATIDQCLDVNYIMFQNSNYGTKWFYGFVTECRYINANVTALKYELDVLQTWYFDYELLPCFIERCHPTTDVIGANILPEPVETGDMIINEQGSADGSIFDLWNVVAFTTFDWNTWTYAPQGNLTDGNMYSGLIRTVIGQIRISSGTTGMDASSSYTIDPTPKIMDLINNHANLVDGLVALVLSPWLPSASGIVNGINKPDATTALAGYTPKNKKLYTWQFYRMFMTDGNGSGKWFAFEDFAQAGTSLVTTFGIRGDCTADQTILCVPKGYKGVSASEYNFEECMSMSGIPQCAWASDAYKTYLALNQGSLSLSLATSATNIVGGVATGIAGGAGIGLGMAASGVMGVVNTLTSLYDKKKEPPKVHGNATSSALFAVARKAFIPCSYTCKPEYLAIIDDFFDMYGYAQACIGTPNIHARPHWTYNRTVGAMAVPKTGSGCSAADLRRIQNIFDNGVTFWADGYEVGDYSLDNRV